jgi:hypothetical protein
MIQFRYGVRAAAVAAHGVAASVYDLPAKFFPLPMTDDEMDAVRLGGIVDPPAKKKK